MTEITHGVRFTPTDLDLIRYLKRKVEGKELEYGVIKDADIYTSHPHDLIANYGGNHKEKNFYFFSPRHRKYSKGNRPIRTAGQGIWKKCSADESIHDQRGRLLGYRSSLTFFSLGVKTDWRMKEYRVEESHIKINDGPNPMLLDTWVLCKIYRSRNNNDQDDIEEEGDEEGDIDDRYIAEFQALALNDIEGNNVDQQLNIEFQNEGELATLEIGQYHHPPWPAQFSDHDIPNFYDMIHHGSNMNSLGEVSYDRHLCITNGESSKQDHELPDHHQGYVGQQFNLELQINEDLVTLGYALLHAPVQGYEQQPLPTSSFYDTFYYASDMNPSHEMISDHRQSPMFVTGGESLIQHQQEFLTPPALDVNPLNPQVSDVTLVKSCMPSNSSKIPSSDDNNELLVELPPLLTLELDKGTSKIIGNSVDDNVQLLDKGSYAQDGASIDLDMDFILSINSNIGYLDEVLDVDFLSSIDEDQLPLSDQDEK